ncbi:hypothetical protein [Spiroplasma diminutum]|uniref:Transmembrane protein n=1 Tax=Spiroplasma diminutum CUAS-1 TaxID=1276221 RepID=S5LWN4_9MOLU|nr:hypothetical protein [Spiroplasma diminutum]AGR42169.1 hypothetical protein SDIMI_v3c04650 [Spiroplasma diminutum CUAS-1]
MKNSKYIIILIFSLLIGLTLFSIYNLTVQEDTKIEIIDQNYVHFKVKYQIKLEDQTILPSKVKNKNDSMTSEELIKNNNLNYLNNLFDIENNSNLKKNNTIHFYPNDNVEVVRISRFEVDQEFFTSRSVSEGVAKKTVDILLEQENTYDECMEKLKKIYVGNTFNVDFYNKALPKLIY